MNKLTVYFNNFLKSPIRLKLFFAITSVIFSVLVATVSFVISYNYENKHMQEDIENKANSYIEAQTLRLHNLIELNKQTLDSIISNELFKTYIKTKEHKEVISSLFEQIIASDKSMMQIRYINADGKEEIRFNRHEEGYSYKVVSNSFLQNKKDRYYFKEVSKLAENTPVWISDIDLNIENGKIQKPYVPTMRFAVPVYLENKFSGIVIINTFMKNILKDMTSSPMFIVSLLDKEGEFLIGYSEVDGRILDFSWSRYLLSKVNIQSILPYRFKTILNSAEYSSDLYSSKNITSEVGSSQELILLLKVRETNIRAIKEETLNNMLDVLAVALLLSIPIALLLAFIPSLLATKVLNATQELEEAERIFDEYLEAMNINNIISKSDLQGRITYVNDNFCKVSGYTKEELIGKPHSILRDPDEKKEVYEILWLTIEAGKTWKGFLKNKKKDGSFYDVDIAIMPIFNLHGELIEYIAIRHDITELTRQRKEILTIATQDTLSNVGNRYKLTVDIKKHILNNVAIIDIDNFSAINDFYGHKVGDEVIVKFSKLLLENLTNEFELYRLHSDKFAIHNYTLESKRFTKFITQVNEEMIESVITTDIESFDIVCTAGISSEENSVIISTAEIANKYAKKINKKVVEYSSDLNIEEGFANNIKWTQIIKRALHDDRITMHYQPLVNNHTKKIEKYEALVRLIDEDGNLISPFHFLDIAKSSGQYIDISKVVIAKSFAYFEDKDVEFSINLTIEDILDDELSLYLDEMLEKYDVKEKLVLEIVESEAIEEFEIIQKFIKRMKKHGCKIAIDDFGTGYSNFEYLVKIDADYIKIDGSLIKNINHDENMKEIVKTIIDFAKKMNFKTIAEFVSSKEILQTVEELGMDYSQGYYLGEPASEIEKS